jgi:hypothetical protein
MFEQTINAQEAAVSETDAQTAPKVHFYEMGSFDFGFDREDGLSPARAYNNCAVLRTVVSRNAQSMSNGRWFITDAPDMTGSDVSKGFPAIQKLLTRPNPDQEWGEFIIQCDVYRQLFGSVFIYASTGIGAPNSETEAVWVLAPREVRRKADGSTFEITIDGVMIEVDEERICEVRDTGIFPKPLRRKRNSDYNEHRKGRVHAARFAIKNITQAEEAIYSINRDRGALGAWVDDSDSPGTKVAISPVEAETLLERLRRAYGIVRSKFKMMVIRHKMKWVPMSMSVRDLMLIEGMNKNLETICNTFDYPMELLVSNSKYSNKEVAKGYYDDAVIPFSLIYASKLRHLLLNDEAYFVIDFSHVPAMKEAEEQKAKVYYQKATAVVKLYEDGILSREEVRLEMGYEQQVEGKTMFNKKDNSNGGTDSGANQSPQGQA